MGKYVEPLGCVSRLARPGNVNMNITAPGRRSTPSYCTVSLLGPGHARVHGASGRLDQGADLDRAVRTPLRPRRRRQLEPAVRHVPNESRPTKDEWRQRRFRLVHCICARAVNQTKSRNLPAPAFFTAVFRSPAQFSLQVTGKGFAWQVVH